MSERPIYVWVLPHEQDCEHEYYSRAALAEKLGVDEAGVIREDIYYSPVEIDGELRYCWHHVAKVNDPRSWR